MTQPDFIETMKKLVAISAIGASTLRNWEKGDQHKIDRVHVDMWLWVENR
jgi:hypothetical protein